MGRSPVPVFVKVPPFATDEERDGVLAMARVANQAGAAGITCANTIPVQDGRLSTGRGGLSGGPLTARTPEIVAAVRASVGADVPINASGGIFTAADARACLAAGATHGPGVHGADLRRARGRGADRRRAAADR